MTQKYRIILVHEIRADSRLALRIFRFLRHQSPSPRTRSTLRGVAESQFLKPDFVAKEWKNENKILLGYFCPLDIDIKTVKIL